MPTELTIPSAQIESSRAHSRRIMHSSACQTWATPQAWFDYLNLEFKFDLDPCCLPETAKCPDFFTPEQDDLKQSWANRRVFMNPPYDQLERWMEKAYRECRDHHALVVAFVPARPDTQWWHKYAVLGEIRYPIGRVKFAGAKNFAPFPVAIIIFRPRL